MISIFSRCAALMCVAFLSTANCLAESRVLYIGDSHSVGEIGREFERELHALPDVKTGFYASCGSRPSSWLSGNGGGCGYRARDITGLAFGRPGKLPVTTTVGEEGKIVSKRTDPIPLLSDLLRQTKPDLVIVELGGNLVRAFNETKGVNDDGKACQSDRASVEKSIRTMVAQIKQKGARCAWIAPPHSRAFVQRCFREVYTMLESLTGETGCTFVDTRPFQHYPDLKIPGHLSRKTDGDGLHYDSLPGGAVLARDIARKAFAQLRPVLPGAAVQTPNSGEAASVETDHTDKNASGAPAAVVRGLPRESAVPIEGGN